MKSTVGEHSCSALAISFQHLDTLLQTIDALEHLFRPSGTGMNNRRARLAALRGTTLHTLVNSLLIYV